MYLQPTQDLTIDAETGPTQFRVSLEGSDTATVALWANKLAQRMQELPALRAFDTVFSMGVLYHRKSPIEHIEQLRNQLKDDGELVLETLVIDGGVGLGM